MNDSIRRQDAIDLAVQIIKEWHGLEDDDADAIKYKFMGLPPAQPEITDEQAIEHLQESGWMPLPKPFREGGDAE